MAASWCFENTMAGATVSSWGHNGPTMAHRTHHGGPMETPSCIGPFVEMQWAHHGPTMVHGTRHGDPIETPCRMAPTMGAPCGRHGDTMYGASDTPLRRHGDTMTKSTMDAPWGHRDALWPTMEMPHTGSCVPTFVLGGDMSCSDCWLCYCSSFDD